MSEENKDLVLRYVDAFNRGDIEEVCSLFTPDAQVWGVLGWGGLAVAKPVWKSLIDCLAMQLHPEDIVSERDIVAVRFRERGLSKEAFMGLGPTGQSYEVMAMEWFQIQDGRIHRRWGARDSTAIMRQLGLTQK